MMNNKGILMILIISIILSFSGCTRRNDNGESRINKPLTHVSYEVRIEANSTVEYFVYVPIIIRSDGTIYDGVMNNLTIIRGSPSYKIIDTEFGKALNISGKGDCCIIGDYEDELHYKIGRNISRFPHEFIDFNLWASSNESEFGLGYIWTFGKASNNESVAVYIQLLIGYDIIHAALFEINGKWSQTEVYVGTPPVPSRIG